MKSTQIYDFSIAANSARYLPAAGGYFRLMTSTASVEVDGDTFGALWPVEVGQGLKGQAFNSLTIVNRSGATVTGTILVSDGEFVDNRLQGDVVISNTGGAFTQAVATVTNASAQLVAASTTRRYLLIQNNDASGSITLRLDGGVAVSGQGIVIPAGGSYEIQGYAPTGAITAIGSIASNTNIVLVQG